MEQMQPLLGDLLDGLPVEQAVIPLAGLALDSRLVKPGDVFVAVNGHSLDGRDFIDDAVARGASAVIADAPCSPARWQLPVVEVNQLARQVSAIAGRFYGNPSESLTLIGVTGTNGKSSVAVFIAQMLEAVEKPCGIIGTLGTGRLNQLEGALNTTPDAIALQQTLAHWRDAGANWAAMEVSSHGLVQHRVEALRFSTAIFTNLSQDHLDYHGSMEEYAQAKAKLFSMPGLKHAVVNLDDAYGVRLVQDLPLEKIISFGLHAAANVTVTEVQYLAKGIEAVITSPWGALQLRTGLIGSINLQNILAAVAALGAEGLSLEQLQQGLDRLMPVPGRMEASRSLDGLQVIVDYAHTPDALEKVLENLRLHCQGKIWCVFGCGGDRDKSKRPLMGAIAERCADKVILTSDNPRSESDESIIDDIRAGMQAAPLRIDVDRQAAIAYAIAEAASNDLVLIAGKGHEHYQERAGHRTPFSDQEEVASGLRRRSVQ